MKEITISTWETLVYASAKAEVDFGYVTVWFRGQPRFGEGWQLVANVFRQFNFAQEADLTNRFRLQAPSRSSNCPSFEAIADWLCLMRHHGLPTRLLDWTQSILVAAFFAVDEDEYAKDEGVIYVLAPGLLNRRWGGEGRIFQMKQQTLASTLQAAFLTGKPSDQVFAALPSEIDPRMLLQQSVFTIHGSAKPLEQFPNSDEFLMRFIIPPEMKPRIQDVLRLCGITQATLFPDLGHLADQLVKQQELIASGLRARGRPPTGEEAQ